MVLDLRTGQNPYLQRLDRPRDDKRRDKISFIPKTEAKEETRSLSTHKMINQEKFSQKELDNSLAKKSYLHGKEKIHHTLLVYQLYNLIGHRFCLLYILELVMVTR